MVVVTGSRLSGGKAKRIWPCDAVRYTLVGRTIELSGLTLLSTSTGGPI